MIFQHVLLSSLERNSDRIAIENGQEEITYAALREAADKVSSWLLTNGKGKGTMVGIMLSERVDFIHAMIGVLHAGCVFVPLDPAMPDQRLAAIAAELSLQDIITSRSLSVPGWANGVNLHFIEVINDTVLSAEMTYPVFGEDDSIYVYFTSGSTGRPKGIVGRNGSLLQFIQWEIAEFGIDSDCRSSQLVNPVFDAFLRDVFTPLLAGGTLCILPVADDAFTTAKMVRWINEKRIQLIHCVPSVFRIFNDASLQASDFPSLKWIMLSGEKINPAELRQWYEVFGDRIQLVNFYGPSETTMIRCFYRISPTDADQTRIPIGQPISGTTILIADEHMVPCAPLVPGELYIISEYVTKGYWNDPERTGERFLPAPADGVPAAVMFKTGDMARLLPNGNIDLLGRNDRQIKLHGVRIEPEEIEYHILRQGDIKNAVVLKKENQHGNDTLVAFVIRKEGLSADQLQESVVAYLKERLPAYMLPSEIVVLDTFPLLDTGKTDYSRLLASLDNRPVSGIVTAINETEQKLLSIWGRVLGHQDISVEESFHRLGGNSLTSMRLVAMIYQEFNVVITLQELYSNITLRKQAAFIMNAQRNDMMKINKATPKPSYVASSAQERMYFRYMLDRSDIAYNMPMIWEIKHEVDIDRITTAIHALVERHESLRTVFRYENGGLRQVIHPQLLVSVRQVNCRAEELDTVFLQFIQPFDLENGPLFRCGIVSTVQSSFLITDMHHIIADGISQINLYADFLSYYQHHQLPSLSIQYKDYAEWESAFRKTPEYQSLRHFWLEQFAYTPAALKLPVIGITTAVAGSSAPTSFSVNKADLQPVLTALRQDGNNLFTVLFTAYLLFLTELTGQDDIVIGIAASGRVQHELENMVGMFTKTLPIRTKIDMGVSFITLLAAVREHLTQANSKQIYDLVDIQEVLNARNGAPVGELFRTMFVFHNFEDKIPASGGELFSVYDFRRTTSKYPIELVANEKDKELSFRFEYDHLLFSAEQIALFTQRFQQLLQSITQSFDRNVGEILLAVTAADVTEDDIAFNL